MRILLYNICKGLRTFSRAEAVPTPRCYSRLQQELIVFFFEDLQVADSARICGSALDGFLNTCESSSFVLRAKRKSKHQASKQEKGRKMSEMLENVVAISNGRPVTTSVKIAIVFGKKHKDVMKAIRELEIPEEVRRRNFSLSSYEQPLPKGGTKRQPMYEVTRDGFTLLAMGFNGKKAMQFKIAYIQAFNAMEKELKNRSSIRQEDLEGLADTLRFLLDDYRDQFERTIGGLHRTMRVYQNAMGWRIPENWMEVDYFCHLEGLKYVNPKKFFIYYTERGWRIDGTPITDWKNVCRSWDLNAEERHLASH